MIERHLAIGRVLGYGNKNGYSPLYFSLHMFLFFFLSLVCGGFAVVGLAGVCGWVAMEVWGRAVG